jgi:hypothetical protein
MALGATIEAHEGHRVWSSIVAHAHLPHLNLPATSVSLASAVLALSVVRGSTWTPSPPRRSGPVAMVKLRSDPRGRR